MLYVEELAGYPRRLWNPHLIRIVSEIPFPFHHQERQSGRGFIRGLPPSPPPVLIGLLVAKEPVSQFYSL